MGLDSFKSKGTSNSSSTTKVDTTDGEQKDIDDAYKVFSADDGRKKVFQDEEDWNEAVEFIENELGMAEEEVINLPPTQRHDILHQAIVGEEGQLSQDFYPTRQCLVCDKVFSFPTTWNFSKFKGEAVCKSHTIKEVLEEYREVNTLHG